MYSHKSLEYQFYIEKTCPSLPADGKNGSMKTNPAKLKIRSFIPVLFLLLFISAGSFAFAQPGLSLYGEVSSYLYSGVSNY